MTADEIKSATRIELIKYLKSWGFKCYDNDPTEMLREAALQNATNEIIVSGKKYRLINHFN